MTRCSGRVDPEIDWKDNTAFERVHDGAEAEGIRVSRVDLLQALLQADDPSEHPEGVAAATWVRDEAGRMKKAGEIPPGITAFARELELRMKIAAAADHSLRPVKWPYIKNKLRDWGCWPIRSIP